MTRGHSTQRWPGAYSFLCLKCRKKTSESLRSEERVLFKNTGRRHKRGYRDSEEGKKLDGRDPTTSHARGSTEVMENQTMCL